MVLKQCRHSDTCQGLELYGLAQVKTQLVSCHRHSDKFLHMLEKKNSDVLMKMGRKLDSVLMTEFPN